MTLWSGEFASLEDLKQWDGAYEHLTKPGVELLFADYDCPDYEGSALVVWRENGKLYEAECSHCSCYGLDDFTPGEVTVASLLMQWRVKGHAEFRAVLEAGPR